MNRHTDKPWVLGLASSHNGSACLLHGDRVVAAVQEERLLRMKRAELHAGESSLAVQYCLDVAGIRASDLDAVVNCPTEPMSSAWMDVSRNPVLETVRHGTPVFTIAHHLGHAIGTFALCGFDDSAVLVVDAAGSRWKDLSVAEQGVVSAAQIERHVVHGASPVKEMISLYHAGGTSVTPLKKWIFSNAGMQPAGMRPFGSLGQMYASVGRQIFGSMADGPGKVMGLAPYGSPTTPVSDFFEISDGEFFFSGNLISRFAHDDRWPLRQPEYRDLAASVQAALEEALFYLTGELRGVSGSVNLCFTGGVALNSVANEKIVRSGLFKDCFFLPAAEDSGTALGAAFYGLWQLGGKHVVSHIREDSAGKRYSAAEIGEVVSRTPGLDSHESDDVVSETVRELVAGKIVGWFEGGSELGPRALGHRSILCDPRDPAMKDIVNSRVKFREGFRPFAPVVLREKVSEWFDVAAETDSPFMLRVMAFRDGKAEQAPAVVHVDGTGRVQTVTPESGRLYQLVARFYEQTGVPILLNTSFNIAGEPIVENPEDALWCFLLSGMDCCVLEDRMVYKDPARHPVLDSTFSFAGQDYEVRGSGEVPFSKAVFFASHADARIADAELKERYPGLVSPVSTHIRTSNAWGPLKVIVTCDLSSVLGLCDGSRTGREVLAALPGVDVRAFEMLVMNLRRMSVISLNYGADAGATRRFVACSNA
jgi:carbamoyltransferase